MKANWPIFLTLLITCTSFNYMTTITNLTDNPLLKTFNTPFQVPPFDLIKPENYMPAFKEAMHIHELEIKAITDSKELPTFDNTIAALDYSGSELSKISNIFFSLTGANTNDSLKLIQQEITPILSQHDDNIILNADLFKRIKYIKEANTNQKLSPDQTILLNKTYKHFVMNGAGLNKNDQTLLRSINEQLASLSVTFGNHLLKDTKAFQLIIDTKKDLSGLPQSIIDAAASDAKNAKIDKKWLFTLDNSSIIPFLTYADNRDLREQMLHAYMMRGNNNNENDNKLVMKQLVNLRSQKALLLGYKNFAALQLGVRMAQQPQNVYDLLNKLWIPALKTAKLEASDLQSYISKEDKNFKLEAWDWRYYAEKVRKDKYDIDEEQLRPYFPLEKVREGAFAVANKLYGITFSELKNMPKYHSDNEVFEVKDFNGSHLGVLYMDFHPRESKRGGAWCGGFRDQYKRNGVTIHPVVSIVCNFSKPTDNAPALLTFDEARTLFHEFGHALQALFSDVTYPGLGNLARDYVELPSQVMENWASDPEILNMYAHHYKTGVNIPADLLQKIEKSKYFNEGFATVEYLAASYLDMDLHTIAGPDSSLNILNFEDHSMKNIGLIPEILPRYRTTYFNHISDDGYSAGYYSYVWAQVLDADAFAAFKEKGIFDQKTAKLFRQFVLEKGGSMDEMEAYKHFRGADPSITPLLKRKGFIN